MAYSMLFACLVVCAVGRTGWTACHGRRKLWTQLSEATLFFLPCTKFFEFPAHYQNFSLDKYQHNLLEDTTHWCNLPLYLGTQHIIYMTIAAMMLAPLAAMLLLLACYPFKPLLSLSGATLNSSIWSCWWRRCKVTTRMELMAYETC